MNRKLLVAPLACLLTAPTLVAPAHADPDPDPDPGDGVRAVFDQPIADIPGKSMIALTVSLPPGGKNPPHRHASSAFIMAYVLSGSIRSQVEGEPARVYHAGETWREEPGAHHIVSQNASATKPAELLAVFVVDSDDTRLTTFDDQPASE